jgi:hypothetical protein
MRYRINRPQVINETIDGEAIMINLATGSPYTLDPVGGDVWALLEASLPIEEMVVELGRRHDADAVRTTSPERATADRPPFRTPRLEKFTDMQDLILLDPVHEVDARGWPHLPDGNGANG